MYKKLVRHGNGLAIAIERSLLKTAGIDDSAKFQVTAIPGKGILIESINEVDQKAFNKAKSKVFKKYAKNIKRLADR